MDNSKNKRIRYSISRVFDHAEEAIESIWIILTRRIRPRLTIVETGDLIQHALESYRRSFPAHSGPLLAPNYCSVQLPLEEYQELLATQDASLTETERLKHIRTELSIRARQLAEKQGYRDVEYFNIEIIVDPRRVIPGVNLARRDTTTGEMLQHVSLDMPVPAIETPAKPAYLVVQVRCSDWAIDPPERIIPIEIVNLHIGRSLENDIVLSDPAVSRYQARISFDLPSHYWLHPLNTTSKTFLNKGRNSMPLTTSCMLKSGDVITLGESTIRFVMS